MYGHLQRQCPHASKGICTPSGSSGPRTANDGQGNGQPIHTGNGNIQFDSAAKGKAHLNTSSSGQDPSSSTGLDMDGFIPVRRRTKGRGQKRSHLDRQVDSGFNRFEALDSMAIEEGIPAVDESRVPDFGVRSSILNESQDIVVQQMPETSLGPESGALVVSPASQEKDALLADLVKDLFVLGKGKGSSLALGLMQRPFKKVSFASPL